MTVSRAVRFSCGVACLVAASVALAAPVVRGMEDDDAGTGAARVDLALKASSISKPVGSSARPVTFPVLRPLLPTSIGVAGPLAGPGEELAADATADDDGTVSCFTARAPPT